MTATDPNEGADVDDTGAQLDLATHPLQRGRRGGPGPVRCSHGTSMSASTSRHSFIGHRHLRFGCECGNPNPRRRSAATASIITGRVLRDAKGSTRGLLQRTNARSADLGGPSVGDVMSTTTSPVQ